MDSVVVTDEVVETAPRSAMGRFLIYIRRTSFGSSPSCSVEVILEDAMQSSRVFGTQLRGG